MRCIDSKKDQGITRSMKGVRREDDPGRELAYRHWRMNLNYGSCTDIDQVEWGDDGQAVGVLEITKVDDLGYPPPSSYFDAILSRYSQDQQGGLAVRVGDALKCNTWIVAFHSTLETFWVYNLSDDEGWWKVDQDGYLRFLRNLRMRREKP
jgi:hypothetical protein